MGFRAGLYNAGKWFRVNELIRNAGGLKDSVNNDEEVQTILDQMDAVLNAEREAAGIAPEAFAEDIAAQGFPIPLRLWQGRLVFSHRAPGQTGLTANQKLFKGLASDLRKRVDEIIRAFSMLSDAYEKPAGDYPNPGGVVGEEDDTP